MALAGNRVQLGPAVRTVASKAADTDDRVAGTPVEAGTPAGISRHCALAADCDDGAAAQSGVAEELLSAVDRWIDPCNV